MENRQTARAANSQLTGDTYIVARRSSDTIASGMAYQMACQRDQARREKIKAVLSDFLQDPILIQQLTAELFKVE